MTSRNSMGTLIMPQSRRVYTVAVSAATTSVWRQSAWQTSARGCRAVGVMQRPAHQLDAFSPKWLLIGWRPRARSALDMKCMLHASDTCVYVGVLRLQQQQQQGRRRRGLHSALASCLLAANASQPSPSWRGGAPPSAGHRKQCNWRPVVKAN